VSLGDSFPASLKRDAITRRLVPGVVVKFPWRLDDGRTKEKRFVVVHVSAQSVMCIINTKDVHFTFVEPALAVCQVRLPRQGHDFMDHDSHIDCSALRVFRTDEIQTILESSTERILGNVSADILLEMASALKRSPKIAPIELRAVLQSIEGN
jgi:hypothetical protein